ncbi:hypothetical protein L249_4254, partial [Ophiocordyceps polyrhachis-furcata BCC 54312]
DAGAIGEGGSRDVLAEDRCLCVQIIAFVYIEEGPTLTLDETVGGKAWERRSAVSVELSLLDSHHVIAVFGKESKVREGVDAGTALRRVRPRCPTARFRSETWVKPSSSVVVVLEATGSRRVCGSGSVLVLAGYFAVPGL